METHQDLAVLILELKIIGVLNYHKKVVKLDLLQAKVAEEELLQNLKKEIMVLVV